MSKYSNSASFIDVSYSKWLFIDIKQRICRILIHHWWAKMHQFEFLWSGHPPTYDPNLQFLQFNVKHQDICVGC